MDKNELIDRLLKKDRLGHLYMYGLLVIMSVLLFFVIRPNVSEYLRRVKLLEDIERANDQYDQTISNLRTLQGMFEVYRDRFSLLDEAIPKKLGASKYITDISTALGQNIVGESLNFSGFVIVGENPQGEVADPVNTSGQGSTLPSYSQSVSMTGGYDELLSAVTKLMNQRRIKYIKSMSFSKSLEENASKSARLNLDVEIEIYHLK